MSLWMRMAFFCKPLTLRPFSSSSLAALSSEKVTSMVLEAVPPEKPLRTVFFAVMACEKLTITVSGASVPQSFMALVPLTLSRIRLPSASVYQLDTLEDSRVLRTSIMPSRFWAGIDPLTPMAFARS